jgi:DNA-binding CsgD family transcriptional regulator
MTVFRNQFSPPLVHKSLERMGWENGFAYYLFAIFPEADRRTFESTVIASNWPSGLHHSYSRADLFSKSRFIETARRRVAPINDPNALFSTDPLDRPNAEIRKAFHAGGFKNTVAFAISDAGGSRRAFAFSGEGQAIPDLAGITLSAIRLLDELIQSEGLPATLEIQLTVRETDFLALAAQGKTSNETADLLGVSNHTVNAYLRSAIKKLGATSKSQAVAISCRMKLI